MFFCFFLFFLFFHLMAKNLNPKACISHHDNICVELHGGKRPQRLQRTGGALV